MVVTCAAHPPAINQRFPRPLLERLRTQESPVIYLITDLLQRMLNDKNQQPGEETRRAGSVMKESLFSRSLRPAQWHVAALCAPLRELSKRGPRSCPFGGGGLYGGFIASL